VLLEYREGIALGIVGEEVPVAVLAGVIHRNMAPVVFGFRAGRAAGLQVGAVGIG